MKKILVVEDDLNLAMNLKNVLVSEGYDVNHAGRLGEMPMDLSGVDLIILDWMLPDGQGLDKIKSLRHQQIQIPILLLTAKADLIDKVLGLESGASDYITKPFEVRELLARIRVQLRRIDDPPLSQNELTLGEISLSHHSRTVKKSGVQVDLTRKEYELLYLFTNSPLKVFTREELLNLVWGFDSFPTTRTVDTHILQLRHKLGETYFETIRGIGYRFNFSSAKHLTEN